MAVFLSEFPTSLGKESSAGQHYMIIDSYESKNATTTVDGRGKKLSSIGLYIPAGSLNTSFTGNYEGKSAATSITKVQALTDNTSRLGNSLTERLIAAGVGFTRDAVKSVTTSFDNNGFISAQGLSPNNHLALVYGGPNQFREHTFAFKFFPKNKEESTRVNRIITEFKQGTLPRLQSGLKIKDAFFKSPRHHKIEFFMGGTSQSDNPFLFKIGTSVITNMVINYDPQGAVGFHRNGAPVSVNLSLTFKEITLPISTDSITKNRRELDLNVVGQQAQAQAANNVDPLDSIRDGTGSVNPHEARNKGLQ